MKEKIDKISKGVFDYQLPELLTSEEIIQLTVESGKTCHGSFRVHNSAGRKMRGIVYSSSRLFVIKESKFFEEDNTIQFSIIADYLDAGYKLDGHVSIISDCGEKILPFIIEVHMLGCDTSLGKVKDMFQFTNLAKDNWDEARTLFGTEDFRKTLQFNNKQFLFTYEALLRSHDRNHALEEFLVAIHKKAKINYSVSIHKLFFETEPYNFSEHLIITKENWGYVELKISSDMDFIIPDRTHITSDDFTSNEFDLGFVINAKGKRSGYHFGNIIIEGIHQKTQISVTCHLLKTKENPNPQIKRVKALQNKLTENYLNFRANKILANEYVAEAEKEIVALQALQDEDLLYDLYRVHLLLAGGKESAAVSLFSGLKAEDKKDSTLSFAAYLYMRTLLKRQSFEMSDISEKMRMLYAKDDSNWLMFWFLLYLNPRLDVDRQKKYDTIKDYVEKGCRSPVIYFEAAALLREEPTLMKGLSSFELKILNFTLKYNLFNPEMAAVLGMFALKEKYFTPLVYHILTRVYEEYKTKELLFAICSLLIRGHKTDKSYLKWYTLGMKQQLKVADLPKYYLMSAEDLKLPLLEPAAYTYYLNSFDTDTRRRAYLYTTLVENSKSLGQQYDMYQGEIVSFAKDQLLKGSFSRDLAIIYESVFLKETVDAVCAMAFPAIMFRQEVICKNKNMKYVCVRHKETLEEKIELLQSGKAFVDIFSDNAEIFFIDNLGNRFCSVEYTIEKLTKFERYVKLCYDFGVEDYRIIIYLTERIFNQSHRDAIVLREKAVKLKQLQEDYRKNHLFELINYDYENFEGDLLEKYLLQIDLHTVSGSDRTRFIEFMIIRGLYNIALKAMAEFGYEDMDAKRLLKLTSRLILASDGGLEKIDIILELCFKAFHAGKYDNRTLAYLADYYVGATKEMFEIWKAVKSNDTNVQLGSFELETEDLEKRLLGQMIFTEEYIDNSYAVFSSYYHKGFDHKLIRAFLSYYAYKYLVRGRVVDPLLFEIIKKEISYEENDICVLALLKYLSTKKQLTDSEITFVDYRIHEIEQKEIELPFFKDFCIHMKIPQHMRDKYYVEYRTDPRCEVNIHYSLSCDTSDSYNDYKVGKMHNACYGIFVYEFVLFCGESLQYYITEELDGLETITESMEVEIDKEGGITEETKYDQLNLILTAKEFGDEVTMLKLLENYIRLDHDTARLFKPIG